MLKEVGVERKASKPRNGGKEAGEKFRAIQQRRIAHSYTITHCLKDKIKVLYSAYEQRCWNGEEGRGKPVPIPILSFTGVSKSIFDYASPE